MTAALRILSPGSFTTVQDLGRPGAAHLGVPSSGAMDDYAHRVANWLVGNDAGCATLEMVLFGARIEILTAADLAITGADMAPRLNGEPVRQWASFRVQAGDQLHLDFAANGCRSYLAVTGGIEVPVVLGSRSTYVGGRIGGLAGRSLIEGDILPRGAGSVLARPRRLPWTPLYPQNLLLRTLAGPHDHLFRTAGHDFSTSTYTVSPQSNRMGCRLSGAAVVRDVGAAESIVSEPVAAGAIQIPADGQPIILLREQTIGGYGCIATVISADLWRIGQARPGDRVRFFPVSLDEAHRQLRAWQVFLDQARMLLTA